MATIVTRAGKGSPLTHNEVDANFNNLNNDKVEESTTITAGTGLSGGGDLSANRTISLANTAVTPGSYGSASAVGTFTVDAQGRLTAASNTNIAIANTAVSGLGTMSTQNANNVAITGGSVNGTTIGGSTAAAGTFTSATVSTGNLTFSSTGQRITGDMSNATLTSRLAFQTSTTDGATRLMALPNGTSTTSAFNLLNTSDANNASYLTLACESTAVAFRATNAGTGTLLPMAWVTGGSERMRLDTSGNLGIGTASPASKLDVVGSAAGAVQQFLKNSNGSTNSSAEMVFGTWSGSTPSAPQAKIAAINAASSDARTDLAFSTYTGTTLTERMRIDSSGNVGIGGTATAFTKTEIAGNLPSSGAVSVAFRNLGTVPSGTTTAAYGFNSHLLTQAASFTCSNFYHFFSFQNSIGAGSTVTNQYGYFADSSLTGATNNYGFYSNIASGSNRWNFYAAGTAQNYFAGNVLVGTTTAFSRLTVSNGGATRTGITVTDGTSASLMLYAGASSDAVIAVDTTNILFKTGSSAGQDNGTERFRINNTGEVIVGVTDQGAYNLQCNGTGVWGAGAYVNGSDARLKDNIQSLDSGLDVVKAMRPVTFQYKPEYSKDQSVQPGFIAQELQTAMAGKPYLEGVVQEGTNHLNVAYQNIIPILVKAIQELEAKVAALEAK